MTSTFHSIRWRLQLWHGVILLLAVVAVCATVYRLAWDNQLRRIDTDIIQKERALFHAVVQTGKGLHSDAKDPRPLSQAEIIKLLRSREFTLPPAVAALFRGREPGYAYFSYRDRDGSVLLQSENAPAGLRFLPSPSTGFAEEIRTVDYRRERVRSSSQGLRSVVGRDITPEREEMRGFGWSLTAAGFGVWSLGLLGGWWLAGRAIRPIETISRTASRIAEGNLQERIDTSGTASELDQLSRVLNQTFERLHAAFERQKQFTADAAHELRTPITIILSETQRILKRERSSEEYREAIQTCAQTADRMRRLVEGLLLLARQESAGAGILREECDIADILRDVVAHLGPLAAEKNIHLHSDLQPARCRADAASLGIVATNLVANAIQHRRSGGNVYVSCEVEDRHVVFAVHDDGPGIAEEDLPHIFERFYRADKARTAQGSGHTGLGLAIVQSIVDAHGGTVLAKSSPGKGARFEVALPI